jgi:hypothetical protein
MYNALYKRPRSLAVLQLRLETILALLNLNSFVCVDLRVQDKLRETDDKKKSVFFQTTFIVRKSLKEKEKKKRIQTKKDISRRIKTCRGFEKSRIGFGS